MKAGILVFSRMDSTRLPGKALAEIAGTPLVGHVLKRAQRAKCYSSVVLATTESASDDTLVEYAKSLGVEIFRGENEDVLARALGACREFELTSFARVCGDRAFLDPNLLDDYATVLNDKDFDVVTNAMPVTFPPGLTTEVLLTKAVEEAAELSQALGEREHMTQGIYRHPDKFRIQNFQADSEFQISTRLVVDNESDLERARFIARELGERLFLTSSLEILELAAIWDKNNE